MRPAAAPTPAEDPRLAVTAGRLALRNPFIVASGPTVKCADQLVLAESSGWAGASLKLAFDPEPYISLPPRYRWFRKEGYHAFTAEKRLTFVECLALIRAGRSATRRLALFANITYIGDKPGLTGWCDMARQAQDAGAHAIELNMCCPNMSFNVALTESARTEQTGASMGQNAAAVSLILAAVRQAVSIPVFVKITPEGGRIAAVAKACFEQGADCVCSVANRLAIADFDVEQPDQGPYRLQDEPTLACFSGPWIKPLALRDVYEIRRAAGPGPAVEGTGGVAAWRDAVQMILCGADLVGVCTETMLRGFEFLPRWLKALGEYLDRHGHATVRAARDRAVPRITSADKLTLHGGYAEVEAGRCTGCGACAAIGHCNAITIVDRKSRVDRARCLACSTCVDVCPVKAIRMTDTGVLPGRRAP